MLALLCRSLTVKFLLSLLQKSVALVWLSGLPQAFFSIVTGFLRLLADPTILQQRYLAVGSGSSNPSLIEEEVTTPAEPVRKGHRWKLFLLTFFSAKTSLYRL